MHKRNFSLTSGTCLNDSNYSILAFDVKVEEGSDDILVLLPDPEDLDFVISTSKWMVRRDNEEPLAQVIEIVGPDGSKIDDLVVGNPAETSGCDGVACTDSKLDW